VCSTNIIFFTVKMKHPDKINISSTLYQSNIFVFALVLKSWHEMKKVLPILVLQNFF